MEFLEKLVSLVFQFGGTVIMAVLFVYIFFQDRKDLKEEKQKNITVLKELSQSNNNIAESLNLLKTSLDNTIGKFCQHDERAIQNFAEIKQDLSILLERK
jgi:hypothetical protein